jgi:D-alanyl-D-alanine dipeptidase
MYDAEKCYLLKPAAEMLAKANEAAKTHGLRIKIFDGYRPHSVQKQMWKLVPNPMYVADPKKGSHHNRGCAVDVTLVDSLGNEIEMPTGFDDFTEKAHHDFMDLPENVLKNREMLKKIMEDAGFIPLNSEWWHYSTPGCSENKILDMQLRINLFTVFNQSRLTAKSCTR